MRRSVAFAIFANVKIRGEINIHAAETKMEARVPQSEIVT